MPEQVTIVARLIVPKPSSLPERGRQPHGNPEKPLPDSRLFLHLYASTKSTKSAVIDKSRENIIFLRGPSTNNRGAQRQALQRPWTAHFDLTHPQAKSHALREQP